MDTFQGLGDVELARVALGIRAVVIEDAVGGVRGLLDFGDEQAGTDGVGCAGGEKVTFAWLDRDLVEILFHSTVIDGGGELVPGGARFDALVDKGSGFGGDDDPTFGFGIALAHAVAGGLVRVDLDTEEVLGVQEFDQQGEGAFKVGVAGDGLGGCGNDLGQGSSGPGAVGDDGFVVRQVRQFPALADGAWGEVLAKVYLEVLTAPDAFPKDGSELEWIGLGCCGHVYFLLAGSAAAPLDLISFFGQFRYDQVTVFALNLNDAVFYGSPGPTTLLEL